MKVAEKYKVNGYYPTIGIECHVQLNTKTKLFSSVSNEARDAAPNSLISHICFGLPGALPVLNEEAVRLATRAAYALETKPQKYSKFDRKHYFYPDLPKGYQISQFDEPIILHGKLTIHIESTGESRVINITRAHMEEDAGKSTHPNGVDYSLVDLNRAGTPLLEIVSEPEIHSAEEAKAYAKELWLRMKYAGVSDVDLYHGNMRFDVNVSVSKDPESLGIRSETKNLNSFKAVEKAVDYEIKRQIELLKSGKEVIQETRGWLDDTQKTVSQRSKENAHDYRYFPDPDLPPIVLDEEYIAAIEADLPTLPDDLRKKLSSKGIDKITIETLLEYQAADTVNDFINLLLHNQESAKQYANWIINIEAPFMRDNTGLNLSSFAREKAFKGVEKMYIDNKLSSNGVKKLLEILFELEIPCENVEKVAEEHGLVQISDSGELERLVDEVIVNNPKPVEDVRNGEMKAIGYLVGQVMQASKGKANPTEAKKMLQKKLSS